MNRRAFVRLATAAPLTAAAENEASRMSANDKNTPGNKAFVIQPESARTYDIGHGEARILVGAEQSAGAWWLASLMSEPGRKTSLHVHYSADEQFYVLEGTLSVWIEDRWQELPAGSVAAVPRGVHHALGNRSSKNVRFLASGNPAGFERYFADIEEIARRLSYASPEFLAELKKIYRKYDSELLGPPPEG
jgi:quercetin dioxygenase-like cupin family protein